MKIEQVSKLSPLDRFIYWIRERHQIALRRRAGKPKPWTDDEVMQTYFFTHPYREMDKVTVWFRENIREPLRDDPRVIFATVAFRWFNYPRTGEALMKMPSTGIQGGGGRVNDPYDKFGALVRWNPDQVIQRLGTVRKNGGKLFTGAFMINSPAGEPKLEAIVRRIDNVWRDRQNLIAFFSLVDVKVKNQFPSMAEAHRLLTKYDGLGGFMAYEIVCDLRYTKWLENAPDKMTWCHVGPGARRGLCRVLGIDFPKGNNATSPPKLKDEMGEMQKLLAIVQKRLGKSMPPFEMREVEHALCEADKYSRALEGDGKMKRTYPGV